MTTPLSDALRIGDWDAAFKLLGTAVRVSHECLFACRSAPTKVPSFVFGALCKLAADCDLQDFRLRLCADGEVGLLEDMLLCHPATGQDEVELLASLEQHPLEISALLLAFHPFLTLARQEMALLNTVSFGTEEHLELVLPRVPRAAVQAIVAQLEAGDLPPPVHVNSVLKLIERSVDLVSGQVYANICKLAAHAQWPWPVRRLRYVLRALLQVGVPVPWRDLVALADIDIGGELWVSLFDAAMGAANTRACANVLFVASHDGASLMHRLCQLGDGYGGSAAIILLKRYKTHVREHNLVDTEDAQGMAAIDWALEHDRTSIAVALLRIGGANCNRPGLLCRGIDRQNIPFVRRLVEADGIDISLALDAAGVPLFDSLRMGDQMRAFLVQQDALFGNSYRGLAMYFATKPCADKVRVEIGRDFDANDLRGLSETMELVSGASLTLSFVNESASGDGVERDCFGEILKCCLEVVACEVGDGCTIRADAPGWCLPIFGALLGYSLAKRIPIPSTLSLSFVSRLMERECQFADLKAYDANLYRTLLGLRESSPDDLEDLELTMSDEVSTPDKKRKLVEFVHGGESIRVTHANLDEYLDFRAKHAICAENNDAMQAVMCGFATVVGIPGRLDTTFVRRLLCGSPTIDVAAWKASADCRGQWAPGYIDMFWDLVAGWDHATRSALLKFSTGSSREPAAGFPNLLGYCGKVMPFVISEAGQGRMPSAQTCFNQLALPLYSDKAELESRLRAAFQNQSLED